MTHTPDVTKAHKLSDATHYVGVCSCGWRSQSLQGHPSPALAAAEEHAAARNDDTAAKARALDKYLHELDETIAAAEPVCLGQDWQMDRLVMERERWDRRIEKERNEG